MDTGTDYKRHWDEKFRTRGWGRYPPEDLVRFVGWHYPENRNMFHALEIGSGTGANLWFLHREGFKVSGIDGSPAGIEIARARLTNENAGLNPVPADLRIGDFSSLPWPDNHFDLAIDIFSIYANRLDVIGRTVAEARRVLKPGGRFYSKLWGRNTAGYGEGQEIEPGTYDKIPRGPCADMGLSHFFDESEIREIFGAHFIIDAIDIVQRTHLNREIEIEEYHCLFRKGEV